MLALVASLNAMSIGVGDKFPAPALAKFGCSGKKSVIFFYGADDAPSCSKQISAMDAALSDFDALGVKVVGVRNPAGVKDVDAAVTLAVDEEDAVRSELDIPKDFLFLGGRQSYVVDAAGTIAAVHNNQFDTDSHVAVTLDVRTCCSPFAPHHKPEPRLSPLLTSI